MSDLEIETDTPASEGEGPSRCHSIQEDQVDVAIAKKIGEPSPDFGIRDSVVYSHNYFEAREIDGESHAICLLCVEEEAQASKSGKSLPKSKRKKKKLLKTNDGTTKPLFTHMEAWHPDEYVKMMKKHQELESLRFEARKRKRSGDGTKQLTLIGNNNNQMTVNDKLDPKLQARWDDAVVKFVCETGVSFHSCEKLDILLGAVWNGRLRLKVRTDRTVAKHVGEKSLGVMADVYSILNSAAKECGGLGFTTDMWRSRALDSYIAFTCHFINQEMELLKFVPFVQYFGVNHHTGRNIKLFIDQFLATLGMDGAEMKKTIVCDNASTNKLMLRLSDDLQEYYCNIHTMQLVIIGVFELDILAMRVDEVMLKCRELAKFVRKSELNKNELKEACESTGTNFILPKLPNDTRWHSKEANVSTTIKLKSALQYISQDDTSLRWFDVIPNAAEFKLLESLVEILARIKVACKVWEADKTPTIQTVIPELFNIRDVLKKKVSDRERYVSSFARELLKMIEQRFPDCGTRNKLNSVAHLLDPEYQGLILKQFGGFNRAVEEVKRMGSKYQTVEVIPPPTQVSRRDVAENDNLSASQRLKLMEEAAGGDDRVNTVAPNMNSNIDIELEKFLNMKIPMCTNLLLFYREHKDIFPILTKVAREIFAIPASSATSERVFSVGSLICTARRSRLNPDKVSDLMLMRLNSAEVDAYKEKYEVEKKFQPKEIRDLIRTDLEARRIELEEEEDEVDYIEDLEVEEEDLEVPNEIVMVDVEDNIL